MVSGLARNILVVVVWHWLVSGLARNIGGIMVSGLARNILVVHG